MNPTISERLRKFRDNQKPLVGQEVVMVVGKGKQEHQQTIQRYASKFGMDLTTVPAPSLKQSAELRKSVEQRLSAVPNVSHDEGEEAWVTEIASLLKKSSPRFDLPVKSAPLRVENAERPLEALDLLPPPAESQKEFFLSLISKLRGSTDLDLSTLTDDGDDSAFERIKSRLFGAPEAKAKEVATETVDLSVSADFKKIRNFRKTPSPSESVSWQLTDDIHPLQSSLDLSKSDILTAQMMTATPAADATVLEPAESKPEPVHMGVQDERRILILESSTVLEIPSRNFEDAYCQSDDSVPKKWACVQTDDPPKQIVRPPPPVVKVRPRPVSREPPLLLPDYLHPINWSIAAEKEYSTQKQALLKRIYDRPTN